MLRKIGLRQAARQQQPAVISSDNNLAPSGIEEPLNPSSDGAQLIGKVVSQAPRMLVAIAVN
jgi:hypothetical protein